MNLDNVMDQLVQDFSEDEIRNAYEAAARKYVEKQKQEKIVDARSKVLATLTEYFIAVWGRADKELIKEFESELITIERKAAKTAGSAKSLDDKEKLQRFMDEILGF